MRVKTPRLYNLSILHCQFTERWQQKGKCKKWYLKPYICWKFALFSSRRWWSRRSNGIREERTWKKSKSRKQVVVSRSVDCAQKVVKRAHRQQDIEKELRLRFSTGWNHCRHGHVDRPEKTVDNQGQKHESIFYSGAFEFLFWWTPNRTQFLFNEDLFLKFEGSKILLDQENQLLQGLIEFFKHLMAKIISQLE